LCKSIEEKRDTLQFFSYDKQHALLILLGIGDATDAEHEDTMQRMALLKEEGRRHPRGVIFIMVIDPARPRPNATWRKRFADADLDRVQGGMHMGLVTSSKLLWGVMKAVDWLSPPAPPNQRVTFSTFSDAVQWSEQTRGEKLPMLHRMYEDLLQQARLQGISLASFG
jgi:hypothetical protein